MRENATGIIFKERKGQGKKPGDFDSQFSGTGVVHKCQEAHNRLVSEYAKHIEVECDQ